MIIATKNIGIELGKFDKTLTAANYQVDLWGIWFKWEGRTEFSINDFKQVMKGLKEVDGLLVDVSWLEIYGKINRFLGYTGSSEGARKASGIGLDITIPAIAKERAEVFWKIVKNYIQLPPENCYEYSALLGDQLFGGYVMWFFCEILLCGNEGIVLGGGSFD